MCHVPIFCYDTNELTGDDIFCKAERAFARGEVLGIQLRPSEALAQILSTFLLLMEDLL